MTHAFYPKDFIWNYKHNTHTLHEKKQDFLDIHISDILYLTISTLHLFEAEWFLPPPPIEKAEGGDRRRALGTPCRCGPEGIKQTNKENLWHRHRQTSYCCQRFTAAVQPASYAGKTESSLYPPYKPVNEVRKYDEYAAFSFDYHMHTFRLGGGGSGGVYESGWFGNFEIFWNCYLKKWSNSIVNLTRTSSKLLQPFFILGLSSVPSVQHSTPCWWGRFHIKKDNK